MPIFRQTDTDFSADGQLIFRSVAMGPGTTLRGWAASWMPRLSPRQTDGSRPWEESSVATSFALLQCRTQHIQAAARPLDLAVQARTGSDVDHVPEVLSIELGDGLGPQVSGSQQRGQYGEVLGMAFLARVDDDLTGGCLPDERTEQVGTTDQPFVVSDSDEHLLGPVQGLLCTGGLDGRGAGNAGA